MSFRDTDDVRRIRAPQAQRVACELNVGLPIPTMTAELWRGAECDRRPPVVTTGPHLLDLRQRGVDVTNHDKQRERTRILDLPLERAAACLLHFDDLDARAHRGRPADRPPDLRVGKAEHVSKRRVRVGVVRRPGNVESQAIPVERDRLVEVGDDRAEEVA